MPIYRFSCCGKEIEVIQGIDKDTPKCLDCGAEMKRLISAPAMIAMKDKGGIPAHSKGYKEGYAKNYKRRLQEAKS